MGVLGQAYKLLNREEMKKIKRKLQKASSSGKKETGKEVSLLPLAAEQQEVSTTEGLY